MSYSPPTNQIFFSFPVPCWLCNINLCVSLFRNCFSEYIFAAVGIGVQQLELLWLTGKPTEQVRRYLLHLVNITFVFKIKQFLKASNYLEKLIHMNKHAAIVIQLTYWSWQLLFNDFCMWLSSLKVLTSFPLFSGRIPMKIILFQTRILITWYQMA